LFILSPDEIRRCDSPRCCSAARQDDSGRRQAKLLQDFMGLRAGFAWKAGGGPVYGFRWFCASVRATEAFSMTAGFDGLKKTCARLRVVAMVAFGATACSSIPDWVDPTTWVGGGDPSDSETSPGETPDLAAIPDRPVPTSTADEQSQVTASLAGDRSRAKYSADALRGGTEPAAAPPPPSPVASNDIVVPHSAPPSAPAPAQEASTGSNGDQGDNSPTVDATAQAAPPPPPAPEATELTPAQPSAANTAPESTAPASPSPVAMVSPPDAALGFKPSTAPPLDPTVGQFVPPPIIARYDQTAKAAGVSPRMVAIAEPTVKMKSSRGSRAAVGGPEAMSGAVVANLDALQPPPSATQAAAYSSAQGLPPASVVLFPGDGTLLNAEARGQVRAAVEAFKQAGGQGYVRIVGHASSRTSNMPLERHLEVIFNKSQDRANAVAKEVIREGVPANRVLVEAVGDSQPVYYESMPKGEDGNRRAEIYLQS
jgi:outer membrane protein OmpA-like peptidoglycan-associated protein